MERRNYFEILSLDFDPPESNEKNIKQAIAEWERRLQNLFANESEDRKREISAELALKDDMEKTLYDPKARNAEARALKEKRIGQLEQLIDIMLIGQSGTPEVTNAQIQNVNQKLKLSKKTIEETYVKKGYVVQKRQKPLNLNDTFLDPIAYGRISGNIDRLRAMSIPQFPWTSKVFDLFDLACYYSGDGESEAPSYRKMRTDELKSKMESGAITFATENYEMGHLLAYLFNDGNEFVFDSETNRKKYEQSLEREKLKDFFALLKAAPDDFKKDRYFADSCISTIQKRFPDYNFALALYNREAGLQKDPYEPVEALIHVTCGICKTPMTFRTREEAEKGKCAACGADLYISCPNCHKKVPASADWCSCGFRISEMQFFDEYYKAAQFALKEMNLVEARKQLANAQNAYPNHPKLSALQKQVEAESAKYQKPLDELKALIDAGNFYTAQKFLTSISTSMPQLNLDRQRKTITEKIAVAQRMMPAANLPSSERANRCIEILDKVRDYQPALDMLTLCKPNVPLNLRGAIGAEKPLTCTLTWEAAGEKGVSYCVVRKINAIPRTHADGETLAKELNALEFKDKTIQPGITYGYAVFAVRMGVYSDPGTCEAETFSELDARLVRADADNGACRFSWVLPANCVGVRIIRCQNNIPPKQPAPNCTILTERATANYDDKSVSNNNTYGYRLQCVYPYRTGFRYSDGYTVMLTPEQPPVALLNVTAKTEGRTVFIHWTAPDAVQRSVLIREVNSAVVNNMVGQIVPATDINSILGNGKTYANTTALAQQCQFDIPLNVSLSLAVVTISGAKGIISEVVRVSSVEKCEINKAATRIEGQRLKIILQNLPANLERIHYMVARKVDSRIPWATVDDVKNNMLNTVTVTDYCRDGMILIDNPPRTDLYISVIGQYKMPDSSVVFSDPAKLKVSNIPKQTIRYHLTWGGGLFSSKPKPKDCKLYVTTDAAETPELKLVYRSDGHIPMRLLDPMTHVLHTIQESDTGFPSGQYVYKFPDSTWENMKPQTELRLMAADDDLIAYEIIPENIALLKVPQK